MILSEHTTVIKYRGVYCLFAFESAITYKWLISNHSFISNYIFGTENIVTRDINIELVDK